MALTGNELVTADGLKALHDYNEETYIKNGNIIADNIGAFATDFPKDEAYTGDCNDLTNGIWKIGVDATNKPDVGACVIMHKVWDTNFAIQMAFVHGTWKVMFRYKAGGVWGEWEDKFLPLNGSVSMTGQNLWLNNNKGKIASDTNSILMYIQNDNDDTNRRALVLNDNDSQPNLSVALMLRDKIDGVDKHYRIYGEHNKPTVNDVDGAFETSYELQTDANLLTDGVWKLFSNASNIPEVNACTIYHKTWDENFATQIALSISQKPYFRFKTNGVWQDWSRGYTTLNPPTTSDIGAVPSDRQSEYNFNNVSLNTLNIDEVWNYNYITAISDGEHGTVPINNSNWLNVVNFFSYHFVTQLAFTCASGTNSNRNVKMWIREKYIGDTSVWSDWRLIHTASSITAGTADLTAGTSTLANDCIYQVYQ